jgi:hypothetical protein
LGSAGYLALTDIIDTPVNNGSYGVHDIGAYELTTLGSPPVFDSLVASADTICASGTWTVNCFYHNASSVALSWSLNGGPWTAGYGLYGNNFSISGSSLGGTLDSVICKITSRDHCNRGSVYSTWRKLVVPPTVNVSVSIIPPQNTICQGGSGTFTVNGSGGGSNPVFRWYMGGSLVSSASSYTATNIPSYYDGQMVKVTMTSSSGCTHPALAVDSSYWFIRSKPAAPTIVVQYPFNSPATLQVTNSSSNTGTGSYQFFKDGAYIVRVFFDFYDYFSGCGIYYCVAIDPYCNSDTSNRINFQVAAPLITDNGGDLLTSSVNVFAHRGSSQWYLNGTSIPSGTTDSLTALQNGDYYQIVTQNGCASQPSNTITISDISTSVYDIQSYQSYIYPNPSKGVINIQMAKAYSAVNIRLTDQLGRIVMTNEYSTSGIDNAINLDASAAANGFYFLNISYDGKVESRSLVIVK